MNFCPRQEPEARLPALFQEKNLVVEREVKTGLNLFDCFLRGGCLRQEFISRKLGKVLQNLTPDLCVGMTVLAVGNGDEQRRQDDKQAKS